MMSLSRFRTKTRGSPTLILSSYRSFATNASFLASDLKIVKKPGHPSPLPALNTLKFGSHYSDHMLVADWSSETGWGPPVIKPLAHMSLHPGNSALQYAITCFDGIKAFRLQSGEAAIFRGDLNSQRFLESSVRMGLPSFEPKELLTCMKALVKVDKEQIPNATGYSMYIRPTMISLQPSLGVTVATTARMYAIMSPVGPYFSSGFKPIQLLADTKHVRAWEGGMGKYKSGSNYGPTVMPAKDATSQGYTQILWLYPHGDNDYQVTEVGTMNLMVYWKHPKTGKNELVTPPLSDLILPGVTRRSVLELAKEMKDDNLDVKEETILMSTLIDAIENNNVIEIFGTGTAAIVSPVNQIGFKGKKYDIPLNEETKGEGIGKLGRQLLTQLQDIQYGKVPHKWAIKVE